MPRDRDETSGRYQPTYPKPAFISALSDLDAGSSTPEVREQVGCSYRIALDRLKELDDDGLVECRKVGNVYLWSFSDAGKEVAELSVGTTVEVTFPNGVRVWDEWNDDWRDLDPGETVEAGVEIGFFEGDGTIHLLEGERDTRSSYSYEPTRGRSGDQYVRPDSHPEAATDDHWTKADVRVATEEDSDR